MGLPGSYAEILGVISGLLPELRPSEAVEVTSEGLRICFGVYGRYTDIGACGKNGAVFES